MTPERFGKPLPSCGTALQRARETVDDLREARLSDAYAGGGQAYAAALLRNGRKGESALSEVTPRPIVRCY